MCLRSRHRSVNPSSHSPRLHRVKPQAYSEIPAIEEELGLKLSPLAWLPNFFSLPPEAQIASTQAYQQGQVIASGLPPHSAITIRPSCALL